MALIRLVLAMLAILAAACADVLDDCDDCRSTVTALNYGPIPFGGVSYGAFAVYSNGYFILLETPSSAPRGYSFNPSPISQTNGSPMVAGYWADAKLSCSGVANDVTFEESCDGALLAAIRTQISGIDSSFIPTSAVVVKYNRVQRYNCPAGRQANTFTMTLATSSLTLRSYVIFDYDGMQWDRGAASPTNPPTVGYSNGNGLGFQLDLGSDPVATLNRCRRVTLRVDQAFGPPLVQMNRGNVALAQQDPKLAEAMYGQAKTMYGIRETARAVEQSFPEKNAQASAMEDKLTRALQSAGN